MMLRKTDISTPGKVFKTNSVLAAATKCVSRPTFCDGDTHWWCENISRRCLGCQLNILFFPKMMTEVVNKWAVSLPSHLCWELYICSTNWAASMEEGNIALIIKIVCLRKLPSWNKRLTFTRHINEPQHMPKNSVTDSVRGLETAFLVRAFSVARKSFVKLFTQERELTAGQLLKKMRRLENMSWPCHGWNIASVAFDIDMILQETSWRCHQNWKSHIVSKLFWGIGSHKGVITCYIQWHALTLIPHVWFPHMEHDRLGLLARHLNIIWYFNLMSGWCEEGQEVK